MVFSHSKLSEAIIASHNYKICISDKLVEAAAAGISATIRCWIRTYREVMVNRRAMGILRSQAVLRNINLKSSILEHVATCNKVNTRHPHPEV